MTHDEPTARDAPNRHRWDLSPSEARDLQRELATRVVLEGLDADWQTVAGLDVSYNRGDDRLFAAAVLVERGSGRVLEVSETVREVPFPYVPGLLSFREAPPLIDAIEGLSCRPDVLLCDGQGLAHPRRFGVACHLGLWFDLPSIGCAKSYLCGDFDPPGPNRGDRSELTDAQGRIGTVLRSRDRVQPVYVSTGHRCDHEQAVAVVLELLGRYRLPEPARLAHQTVNALRLRTPDADPGDATID